MNGEIHVTCRDGLWRLRALNRDGKADSYELFNGDLKATRSFHDTVTSIRLLEDKRTVVLEIPSLKPVMQMSVKYSIKAGDGTPVSGEILHAIHALAE